MGCCASKPTEVQATGSIRRRGQERQVQGRAHPSRQQLAQQRQMADAVAASGAADMSPTKQMHVGGLRLWAAASVGNVDTTRLRIRAGDPVNVRGGPVRRDRVPAGNGVLARGCDKGVRRGCSPSELDHCSHCGVRLMGMHAGTAGRWCFNQPGRGTAWHRMPATAARARHHLVAHIRCCVLLMPRAVWEDRHHGSVREG